MFGGVWTANVHNVYWTPDNVFVNKGFMNIYSYVIKSNRE